MNRFFTLIAIGFFSSTLMAEEIRIPVGSQTTTNELKKPMRGSTQAQVEAQFGEPESKVGPAGDPPIHFWEYKMFTVYFEKNTVIHAVSKFKSTTPLKN